MVVYGMENVQHYHDYYYTHKYSYMLKIMRKYQHGFTLFYFYAPQM